MSIKVMKKNIKDDTEYSVAFEYTWLLLFLIMQRQHNFSYLLLRMKKLIVPTFLAFIQKTK